MAANENQKLNRLERYSQEKFLVQGSLLNQTKLERFLIIALLLHAIAIISQFLFIEIPKDSPKPPPIKIKYVNIQKSKIIEQQRAPAIEQNLKHEKSKKNKLSKQKKYRDKKQTPPKTSVKSKMPKNIQAQIDPKKTSPWSKNKAFRKSASSPSIDQIRIVPESTNRDNQLDISKKIDSKGVLAMLDGFDPRNYAKQDSQNPIEEGLENDKPIPLNTTETKYFSYFNRIKHQIQRVWQYPTQASQKRLSGQLTLKFQISRDGNLISVHLIDNSGFEILDSAALKAVKEAAPYYPFPITISKKKLSILATFVYSPNAN